MHLVYGNADARRDGGQVRLSDLAGYCVYEQLREVLQPIREFPFFNCANFRYIAACMLAVNPIAHGGFGYAKLARRLTDIAARLVIGSRQSLLAVGIGALLCHVSKSRARRGR